VETTNILLFKILLAGTAQKQITKKKLARVEGIQSAQNKSNFVTHQSNSKAQFITSSSNFFPLI
jgi:hypothetical protein